MKISEGNLDRALELSLQNLRKNLEEPGEAAGEKVGRNELLAKAREMVKAGKLGLLEAGIIESRVNKGISLNGTHRAILGLSPGDKIQGLEEPAVSSVASRMGGEKTRPATRINTTGAPAPINPIIEEMSRGQTLLHSFQQPNNEIMKVTGREILKRCRQLVQEGRMNLVKSGDIERLINSQAVIRPEILREIFAI